VKIYSIETALKIFAFRNKYDILSNKVASKIFGAIKNRIDNKINFEDSILDQECIIDFSVSFNKEYSKKMEVKAVFTCPFEKNNEQGIEANIDIKIYLKADFAKHDLERLYYRIYEAVRHEYEHFDKYLKEEMPSDEYKEIFESLEKINLEDINKARLIAKYILDPIEIDSYAKSIMYIAKKRGIPYSAIIDDIIKRAMFSDNNDIEEKMNRNTEVVNLIKQVKDGLIKRIKEIYPTVILKDVFWGN